MALQKFVQGTTIAIYRKKGGDDTMPEKEHNELEKFESRLDEILSRLERLEERIGAIVAQESNQLPPVGGPLLQQPVALLPTGPPSSLQMWPFSYIYDIADPPDIQTTKCQWQSLTVVVYRWSLFGGWEPAPHYPVTFKVSGGSRSIFEINTSSKSGTGGSGPITLMTNRSGFATIHVHGTVAGTGTLLISGPDDSEDSTVVVR